MILTVELIWLVFILSNVFDAATLEMISGTMLTVGYTFIACMLPFTGAFLKMSNDKLIISDESISVWNYIIAAINVMIALLYSWYFLALVVAASFVLGVFVINKHGIRND